MFFRKRPKFEVGEFALLVPGDRATGHIVCVNRVKYRKGWTCMGKKHNGYGYWVSPDYWDSSTPWIESVLRKIPPPEAAKSSFTDIMKGLNVPAKEVSA